MIRLWLFVERVVDLLLMLIEHFC